MQELLQQTDDDFIELQRRILAQQFRCVPSQINYVLTTRFTVDKGYLVESRRGEGGYIRIQQLSLLENRQNLLEQIGESIGKKEGDFILQSLLAAELLKAREYKIVKLMLQEMEKSINIEQQNLLRANLLKGMILALT